MKKTNKQLNEIIKDYDNYVLKTYTRKPYVFIKGKGSWLETIDHKKILDFFPGWGVSNFGHCHPMVVKAICEQAKKIIHMANVFYMPDQAYVAKEIVKSAFPGKVFFSNSGAEAVECAIKTAKAWGNTLSKNEFISFEKSFHGRTIGALTLTGQEKYRSPFGPLMPNVQYAKYNDIDSVRSLINKNTAAVILELVQGEGGVRLADKNFVKEIARLAKEKKFLLIFDEVQTGFGRTGKMFAFQNYGVKPDILCMGKSIAGGVAMGATLLAENIEGILLPGMHASTYGGNYIACAGAKAVMELIKKEKVLEKMKESEKIFHNFFLNLSVKYKEIISYRHLGLMFGIEMEGEFASKIADMALTEGLIINCTAGNVLRIMPALNISKNDILKGLKIIEKVFKNVLQ